MSATKSPTVVLVHGAWGGSWIWRRTIEPLREAGFPVHAITLTGLGDRAHLRRRDITLGTHIEDVVALVTAEECREVVLVGHSYGGIVITGAAEALAATDTASVRGLVYVDAMVPHPGEGWGAGHPPDIVAARIAAASANDHALPPPDVSSGFALSEADAAWLNRRHVPHPFGMYQEPLHFDEAMIRATERLFIHCTNPAYPTISPMRTRVEEEGWQVQEIATGHFPMVSEPDALNRALLRFLSGL